LSITEFLSAPLVVMICLGKTSTHTTMTSVRTAGILPQDLRFPSPPLLQVHCGEADIKYQGFVMSRSLSCPI